MDDSAWPPIDSPLIKLACFLLLSVPCSFYVIQSLWNDDNCPIVWFKGTDSEWVSAVLGLNPRSHACCVGQGLFNRQNIYPDTGLWRDRGSCTVHCLQMGTHLSTRFSSLDSDAGDFWHEFCRVTMYSERMTLSGRQPPIWWNLSS